MRTLFRGRVNQNTNKYASFEFGLIVSSKRPFLSVTPTKNFSACSFDKIVSFVQSGMSETFLSVIGHF